jgi:truncated hemoglobin YjbI
MEKQSIFEKVGGAPSIHVLVELFYQKQLADPVVKGFFKSVDLEKLKAHQRDFFTKVLGGPDNYKGRNLVDSHKNLYITEWHFDSVKKNLVDSLEELKVEKQIIEEVAVIVEGTRKDIVYKKPELHKG